MCEQHQVPAASTTMYGDTHRVLGSQRKGTHARIPAIAVLSCRQGASEHCHVILKVAQRSFGWRHGYQDLAARGSDKVASEDDRELLAGFGVEVPPAGLKACTKLNQKRDTGCP
jgi:hypothetical protein